MSAPRLPFGAAELALAHRVFREALRALPAERWGEQPLDDYSPVGWHAGHVAAMMLRWFAPERAAQLELYFPERTPKSSRAPALPPASELLALLEEAEQTALSGLARGLPRVAALEAAGVPPEHLVAHLQQHALQHAEHVRVIAALCDRRLHRLGKPASQPRALQRVEGRLELPGGPVLVGSQDAAVACDNERPPQTVTLRPFWIDRSPLRVRELAVFVAEGGYLRPELWSAEGWAFREQERIESPRGWIQVDGPSRFVHPDGPQADEHPATCLSWFEAEAIARFRGGRLPTEAEWELAAGPEQFPTGEAPPGANEAAVDGAAQGTQPVGAHAAQAGGAHDLAGNVWEWCGSWFAPYPGFRAYPYDGYSTPWFGTHRVLKGGSWATSGLLCRRSFRNWYAPGFRALPAGMRCAGDLT